MDRVGLGSDLHRLEEGIPLVVGGVRIPADFGAVGHSDADVLIHAVCDALPVSARVPGPALSVQTKRNISCDAINRPDTVAPAAQSLNRDARLLTQAFALPSDIQGYLNDR